MLEPSTPSIPAENHPRREFPLDDDNSYMDGYGEASGDARTLGGGGDFFSNLGKERMKVRPDKPDPEKVVILINYMRYSLFTQDGHSIAKNQSQGTQPRSQRGCAHELRRTPSASTVLHTRRPWFSMAHDAPPARLRSR